MKEFLCLVSLVFYIAVLIYSSGMRTRFSLILKIVPIKPLEEEKRLFGDIERIVEVHSRSNDSELLDHIKRLENEVKFLKKKFGVVQDDATGSGFKDATYMYDEGHTKKDVDEDLNLVVESLNEVVDNEEKINKDDNVDPESLFRVFVDEVQMNTNYVGSDIGEGKEMIIFNPKSSIVKNVQQRKDRLKKTKDPDCMTAPSTTPKRKRKQHSTQFLDVDDIDVKGTAKSVVEESLHEFRGRQDYNGCD